VFLDCFEISEWITLDGSYITILGIELTYNGCKDKGDLRSFKNFVNLVLRNLYAIDSAIFSSAHHILLSLSRPNPASLLVSLSHRLQNLQ